MDAREVIRHFLQGTDLSCDDLITALEWHGNRIIHDSENHGPTRERAARIADRRAAMIRQVSHEAALALLQALPDAIRAMEVKHG